MTGRDTVLLTPTSYRTPTPARGFESPDITATKNNYDMEFIPSLVSNYTELSSWRITLKNNRFFQLFCIAYVILIFISLYLGGNITMHLKQSYMLMGKQ